MAITGPPIRSPFTQTEGQGKMVNLVGRDWMKWFQSIVTTDAGVLLELAARTPLLIPGPFANDAAAATAKIPIGAAYYQPSGAMVVRLV